MRAVRKPMLLGGLLLGLGACTTALPPEKTEALGGPFNEQIKQGYLQLAAAQRAEFHLGDWYHFRSKARAAVLGDTVWPDKVASRTVPEATQVDAIERRERLLTALESGARSAAPVEAAAAQVNFDCWLAELASSKSEAGSSDCKESFEAALAKAESALVDTPYVVLFESGSDQLDPDAMNVIFFTLQAARVAAPPEIAVTGYADPAGSPSANQALSQRRAEAVADALRAGNLPGSEIRVAARGATAATPAARARRVEITFGG